MKSTSPSEDAEERAAGAVLFREEGGRRLYLLLRHKQGGHWGFAKGRIEPGEGTRDAALREIREETGIDGIDFVEGVSVESRYSVHRNGCGLLKTVTYYAARTGDGAIHLSHEHTDARWVNAVDAQSLLTHAESRRVLVSVDEALGPTGMS